MILRKPYAFLIKYFKLIHTILSVCMIYLVYKSYNIYNFLNKALYMETLTVEHNSANLLFNKYVFILPWIVIIILAILLMVMVRKKKPKLFYLINIAINIASIIIYNYLYNTILYMEANITSQQTLKLAIDISFILFLCQLISTIVSLIRSIGLDLKKFDFGKDLMELEVNDLDNEEFEINVEIDSNKAKRNLKKRLRYARYVYIENRFIINAVAIILLSTVGFIVYLNLNVLNARYKEGEYFTTEDYLIGVTSSYITNQDSKGKVITPKDKTLLILPIEVSTYGVEERLNLAKTEVLIDGKTYYPIKTYNKRLIDFGETYARQTLTKDLQKYILVYEIPSTVVNKKMLFRYLEGFDIKSKNVKPIYTSVKLEPIKYGNKVIENTANLDEDIVLNETLGNTSINIKSIDMAEEFTVNYNYCLNRIDCYKSVEYIRPNLNTNYDKALLRIEGILTIDEEQNITSIKNLYNAISYFGKLVYTINGKAYSVDSFTKVEAKKYQRSNTYYIEINKRILDSEEVNLIIRVRNKEYKYNILKKEM